MSSIIGSGDVEWFRGIVAAQFGLHFDDDRLEFLAGVLRRRLDAGQVLSRPYLRRLESFGDSAESRTLARELTVGETYFFRNREQFTALAEAVLPERMAARGEARHLNILSAGCASGEEAFTLAMVLREALADTGWTVSIRAVDLNGAALERARAARFGPWALRETPPEMRQRWFRPAGRDWVLSDEIVSAVTFERRNLAVEDAALWPQEHYDVVFCRNVLMYFAPERVRSAVARIAGALAPEGYLFLGHAETLRGLSEDFQLRQSHDTFYYQVGKGGAERSPIRFSVGSRRRPGDAGSTLPPGDPDGWFRAIGESTDRIRVLGETLPDAAAVAGRPAHSSSTAEILSLIRAEKYAEALALVGSPSAFGDPDALLLSAVLLVHSGQLQAAAEIAGRLVMTDGTSAGGHYVLALCSDGAGDLTAAARHDAFAVHLDHEFAMPRLHLGLIAKRGGDLPAARRELAQALVLLRREDPSRLLLFGGGFTREGLTALCRSELSALGERH
jgi:chemotaxis protein methyltransferase CheR